MHDSALSFRTGDLAWVILALARLNEVAPDQGYLTAATEMGEWIETNCRRDGTGIDGGYSGGWVWDWDTEAWIEQGTSTEHNIDLAATFDALHDATDNADWQERAQHAQGFVESMWVGDQYYFETGLNPDGTFCSVNVLDVQAWGSLLLPSDPYADALDWAMNNLRVPVESGDDLHFDFNTDLDGTWYEGTAQMAAALESANRLQDAADALAPLRQAQLQTEFADERGIPAADVADLTTGFDWTYSNRLALGATCWFVFAEHGVNPLRDSVPEPDLAISAPTTSMMETTPGATVNLDVTLQNIGNADAFVPDDPQREWDTTLYRSDDDQFGEDTDSEVAEFALTELAAGATETRTLTFNAPTEPGTYYLAAKTDDFDTVPESDETNNWSGVVTLLVVEVQGDGDDDGLPDEWELDMLGTLDYDGNANPDGDGFSNLQEYENGTDPLRYVLELMPGWNLVSIAVAPADYSVDGIFGGTIDEPAWHWDGVAYRVAEDILPLAGQWVHCPAEEPVSIDIGGMAFPDSPDSDGDGMADSVEEDIGTDPQKYTVTLDPGWNLVSVCRVPDNNSPETIFGDNIIKPVWKWENGQYKEAEKIQPLRGYWIYSDAEEPQNVEINVPGSSE